MLSDDARWSLDPDADGQVDDDAPVLRMLPLWSERGISVFDQDGDLVIDQLEWVPPASAGDVEAWCVAFAYFRVGPLPQHVRYGEE